MTLPPPAGTSRTGELVAQRFRLGRLLGSGGMADVWEATDERLHRTVAIKILRRGAGPVSEAPDAALARFRDEGRLAARRAHPNIVAVFDAGVSGEDTYLVMEHIGGPTLRDRIARGPLEDREAALLMTDVLAALEAAHRSGVVHRDIKPSNVLRDVDGRWKVADFGIAKSLDADGHSDVTRTGQVIGTPQYMAPERLAGHSADRASDIYSAGVLLREALGSPSDPTSALWPVVDRATAVDPAARFASARAMADAIARASELAPAAPASGGLLDDTVPVRPNRDAAVTIATPGAPTRVLDGGPPRPHRGRRLAVVAVLAVLAIGGVAAAVRDTGSDEQQPTTTSTTIEVPPPSSTTTTTPPAATTTTEAVGDTTAPQDSAPVTTPVDPKGKGKGKADPKPGKGKEKGKGPAGVEP